MRRLACVILVLALRGAASGASAQEAPRPAISLADYLAHLDGLQAAVERLDERRPEDVTVVLSTLPRAWTIDTADRRLEVRADWLRRDLTDWRAKPDAATRARTVRRIRAVRADAVSYDGPARDDAAERTRLLAVLASPEFRDLHGPTWFDRLRQRAMQWFLSLIARMLGASAIPTVTNVLVYGLIGLVVALAALWTYRSLRSSAALDTIVPDRIPQTARAWMAWLDDARAAADAGRWPEAIHFAYWCGIAWLEGRGAWRPDRSRTPREYLRLLAASDEHRPALSALTRLIEHVWYGTSPAYASRFAEALDELKRLGCPSR
jgi:hypothetical protein